MTKGISSVISFVITILLTVTAVGIVLGVGLPILDQARETGVLNEANQNMRIIDNLIRQVASEGTRTFKTVTLSVTDGVYRIDSDSNSLDFELTMKSNPIPRGTFKKDGNVITSFGGSASAADNSSFLIIQNEVLEIVFNKTGNETSFDGINTSTIIRTIRSKVAPAITIKPNNTGIKIQNIANTSWGLGYTKLAFSGQDLPRASVLAHVRSNLTGTEYEVLYTLPASADFLLIEVRNTSYSNQTTLTFDYRLGDLSSDILKFGDANETTFSQSATTPTCYTRQNISQLFMCSYDQSEFSSARSSGIVYSGDKDSLVNTCVDVANSEYFFNVTATNSFKSIVPLASGTCNVIGNQTRIVESQGLPSRPFGSYSLTGPAKLQLSLKYDRILLNGTDRFGSGQHKVCIQKIGRQGSNALVDVRTC